MGKTQNKAFSAGVVHRILNFICRIYQLILSRCLIPFNKKHFPHYVNIFCVRFKHAQFGLINKIVLS